MSGKPSGNFDDHAAVFFLGGVFGMLSIVGTVILWKSSKGKQQNDFDSADLGCTCPGCAIKRTKTKKTHSSGLSKAIQIAVVVALWAITLTLAYRALFAASSAPSAPEAIFNPYEILGISEGASDKDIKAAYRAISLKMHPDKNPNDPQKMEKWDRILKAYESLTDELVRANWEKYGNPDGPQPLTMGIALPTWLLDAKNSKVVLIFYFLGFLILVPGGLLFCLMRGKKKKNNELSMETLKLFAQFSRDHMSVSLFIDLICASVEVRESIKVSRTDAEDLIALDGLLSPAHRQGKRQNIPGYAIKSMIVLNSYFSRHVDKMTKDHKKTLDTLLHLIPQLVGGFCLIFQHRGWPVALQQALKFGQTIIQGTWEDKPLLQLPHFTPPLAADCNSKKWRIATPTDLAALHQNSRSALYKYLELTPQQVDDIEYVVKHVWGTKIKLEPEIGIDEDGTTVTYTDTLPAKSVGTLFIKTHLVPTFRPKSDEETKKPKEKKKASSSSSSSSPEEEESEEAETVEEKVTPVNSADALSKATPVHAPSFPLNRRETWNFLLVDTKAGQMWGVSKGCAPNTIGGVPTLTKMKFLAPDKPGKYQLTLYAISDSYIGRDVSEQVRITVVREAAKPTTDKEEEVDEEELLEEEERAVELSDDEEEESGSSSDESDKESK